MKISLIIPVLNEAESIHRYLQPLQFLREQIHEVIIVDGGSSDNTIECVEGLVDIICQSAMGRAMQQNFGASQATGDLLVFLHADTVISQLCIEKLLNIGSNKLFWGRFNVRLSGKHWIFRIIEFFMNYRSCLTGIATGDQAIFISKKLFDKVEAFPEIPLMEDIEISKKLKHLYKPICLKERVITSSRRWEHKGIFRTMIMMWWFRLSYFFGASPKNLAKKYYS
ncbi:MAG: TIGR04283 family arsenosugar biosynthesis glycosyltransferase [Gammaproteobacteria bacterium]|nr:TIGR04283 family arsenosugar biosynthesis glycosyltransferase [Gammaproteobacteria bacterium]